MEKIDLENTIFVTISGGCFISAESKMENPPNVVVIDYDEVSNGNWIPAYGLYPEEIRNELDDHLLALIKCVEEDYENDDKRNNSGRR